MKGCRPLQPHEIAALKTALGSPRNITFFILGHRTGFRVSELLSLSVGDVMQYGQVVSRLSVVRRNMKGKLEGRNVALHQEARQAIEALILSEGMAIEDKLFKSQKGRNEAISRQQAWRVLKRGAELVKLQGKVACHSMRKTFAARVYAATNRDIIATQQALGHKNLNSTANYLSFDTETLDEVILA